MAVKKFTKKQLRLARIAKSLGHPARIAIVEILLKKGTVTCQEIVDKLPLAQSTVSQHLKELKDAGILLVEYREKKSFYQIEMDNLQSYCLHMRTTLGQD